MYILEVLGITSPCTVERAHCLGTPSNKRCMLHPFVVRYLNYVDRVAILRSQLQIIPIRRIQATPIHRLFSRGFPPTQSLPTNLRGAFRKRDKVHPGLSHHIMTHRPRGGLKIIASRRGFELSRNLSSYVLGTLPVVCISLATRIQRPMQPEERSTQKAQFFQQLRVPQVSLT